ncbi:hypothetical protein BLA60_34285 [Actinophytocola xinjiangensis]|uniref:Phospholipid/glycerol acyltransferase domain-containing protein n=1 Tax=Actinophytocola xinjiangensis TaxID=485602 RepID=A0A7Z1AUB9_9PSEU|nr:lysophospholipid acyltransferase family protein [Actinophytocola xinjiangensis]OLF05852.1 hypothetical protein BLA60_34285 [Actinophytocola xinjiangensis]
MTTRTEAPRQRRTALLPTRRRPRAGAQLAALARKVGWRLFFFLLGGIKVHGRLPAGGCVVVANHSSHADAPVLAASLRARSAPRVAAAWDYWFRGWFRRVVCTRLVGAFPMHRQGSDAYLSLREQAGPLLAAGQAVVVFPEGTRGGGELGEFRGGAFRLAAEYGVPVVPVAVCGTGRMLAKRGRLRPQRIGVRIGAPLEAPDKDRARAEVAALIEGHRPRDSRLRVRIARLAASRWGLALVAAWSFTEALSWPLIPESLLAILCVAAPRFAPRLILTTVLASVAGGVAALGLYAATPVTLPQPLTTDRMLVQVRTELRAEGAAAVAHQPSSAIPYKLYSAEAGRMGVNAGEWAVNSLTARGERMVIIGAVLALIGVLAQRWRRFYPVWVVAFTGLFVVGLTLLVRMWS